MRGGSRHVATDGHLDASGPEPGELPPEPCDAGVVGVGGYRQLEPRRAAGRERVLCNLLHQVRRQGAGTLECSAKAAVA